MLHYIIGYCSIHDVPNLEFSKELIYCTILNMFKAIEMKGTLQVA